jgi:hypothetical protein
MSTRSRKIMFLGLDGGRRLRLTALPPSVRRLSKQCGIFNISQDYRPPRLVTGIALLYYKDGMKEGKLGSEEDIKEWNKESKLFKEEGTNKSSKPNGRRMKDIMDEQDILNIEDLTEIKYVVLVPNVVFEVMAVKQAS